MARPRLGESESKRLQMVITEDELAAIDEWQHANKVQSRSEAIRRLCAMAMVYEDAEEKFGKHMSATIRTIIEAAEDDEGIGTSGDDATSPIGKVFWKIYVLVESYMETQLQLHAIMDRSIDISEGIKDRNDLKDAFREKSLYKFSRELPKLAQIFHNAAHIKSSSDDDK